MCIARKIQPRHGKPFLIYRLRVERERPVLRSHADHGIMTIHARRVAEVQREIPRHDENRLSERAVQIQIAAEVEITVIVNYTGTHIFSPFSSGGPHLKDLIIPPAVSANPQAGRPFAERLLLYVLSPFLYARPLPGTGSSEAMPRQVFHRLPGRYSFLFLI